MLGGLLASIPGGVFAGIFAPIAIIIGFRLFVISVRSVTAGSLRCVQLFFRSE